MQVALKYLLPAVLCSLLFLCTGKDICADKDCNDYATLEEAQADFDANPECRKDLDGDGDGIPCELLKRRKHEPPRYSPLMQRLVKAAGECPPTRNCGCSNLRKADCQTVCCTWIVGDGCRCRDTGAGY